MVNAFSAFDSWYEVFESDAWKDLGLTARQQEFVKAYVETHNASKAVRLAGYSEKTSAVQACKLMKNDRIKKAVALASKLCNEPLKPSNEELFDSLAKVIKQLEDVAFSSDGREVKRSDQIKALELLLRYLTSSLSRFPSAISHEKVEVTFRKVDEALGNLQ